MAAKPDVHQYDPVIPAPLSIQAIFISLYVYMFPVILDAMEMVLGSLDVIFMFVC